VELLTGLFREHEAWIAAARYIDPRGTSSVYFSHRPREAWRLVQSAGETRLLPGAARDPDLVFRFSPGAVERLAATRGGIGAFAVELFSCMLDDDPEQRVEFRIAADFRRLAARGYVRLLLAAGPRVMAFGLAHGVASLGALRRLVAELRSREPAAWEMEPEEPDPEPRPRGAR
jgi:hypothetical protein